MITTYIKVSICFFFLCKWDSNHIIFVLYLIFILNSLHLMVTVKNYDRPNQEALESSEW